MKTERFGFSESEIVYVGQQAYRYTACLLPLCLTIFVFMQVPTICDWCWGTYLDTEEHAHKKISDPIWGLNMITG